MFIRDTVYMYKLHNRTLHTNNSVIFNLHATALNNECIWAQTAEI